MCIQCGLFIFVTIPAVTFQNFFNSVQVTYCYGLVMSYIRPITMKNTTQIGIKLINRVLLSESLIGL